MKILTVVQARTSSTRLPGKVLLPILGKSVLELQIERIKSSKLARNILIATGYKPEDDTVAELALKCNVLCYRGSPENLLDRHYKAAIEHKADAIVKIPSDCPLIDPAAIDRVISVYLEHPGEFDYVSNLHPPTYPDGNDVEIMSFKALETSWRNAEKRFELEHTTPFIWDNPDRFRIANVLWETGLDYSKSHRFTLDYFSDYEFICRIYEELYPVSPKFSLFDILQLLENKPELLEINKRYAGEYWYQNHLNELKNIDFFVK